MAVRVHSLSSRYPKGDKARKYPSIIGNVCAILVLLRCFLYIDVADFTDFM